MDTLSEALDRIYKDKTDDPTWTESVWFSWAIPERDTNGFVWVHFRPNQNCICGGVAMWDPSGELVWEFPYFDFQTMRPMPAGRWAIDYDKFDFITPWGLEIRTLESLKRYWIRYDRAGFKLELTWTAVAPPNVMNRPPADQLTRAFRLHFEQPGRSQGFVELEGQRLAVDCFGVRDGGHGPRNMEATKSGAYAWSTADEKTGFHVLAPDATGPEAKVIAGYLLRDGVMSPMVSGTRRVLARTGPRPSHVEIRARDEMGRELHAIGRERAPAKVMLFPERANWWTMCRWDYDGFESAVGEDQEYYGIHEFRRWHRGGPALWKTR